MFGKKKPDQPTIPEPELHLQSIPAEFYGGANPVVQFKEQKREIIRESPGGPVQKGPARSTGPGEAGIKFTSPRFLLIIGGVLFLAFLLGGGVYYWWTMRQPTAPAAVAPTPEPTPSPEPIITPEAASTIPPELAPPEVPTTSVAVTPTTSAEASLTFPSALLGDSVDLDKDGLTDAEEELFKTDPALPDTDGDKYTDGQEVINLYNPEGKEPMKLIDSGLVKEYLNPTFGYKLYYPASWVVGVVDETYRDVLFSTITGEYVEVRVFDKQPGVAFADWFPSVAPNEDFSKLTDVKTPFNQIGHGRNDHLVYYFEDSLHWYVVLYHTTDSAVVNYRAVMQMLAWSFRTGLETNVLPQQQSEQGVTEVPPVNSTVPTTTTP